LYYVIDAVGLALAKGGALPPVAGAWLAPALFLATSLLTIKLKF
jgi:lipopolysaccharide export LptBFGC system permease protein LptF